MFRGVFYRAVRGLGRLEIGSIVEYLERGLRGCRGICIVEKRRCYLGGFYGGAKKTS